MTNRVGGVPPSDNRQPHTERTARTAPGEHKRVEEVSEVDEEQKKKKFQRSMEEVEDDSTEDQTTKLPSPFQAEFHRSTSPISKISKEMDGVGQKAVPSPSYSPAPPAELRKKGAEKESLPQSNEFWKKVDQPPDLPIPPKSFKEHVIEKKSDEMSQSSSHRQRENPKSEKGSSEEPRTPKHLVESRPMKEEDFSQPKKPRQSEEREERPFSIREETPRKKEASSISKPKESEREESSFSRNKEKREISSEKRMAEAPPRQEKKEREEAPLWREPEFPKERRIFQQPSPDKERDEDQRRPVKWDLKPEEEEKKEEPKTYFPKEESFSQERPRFEERKWDPKPKKEESSLPLPTQTGFEKREALSPLSDEKEEKQSIASPKLPQRSADELQDSDFVKMNEDKKEENRRVGRWKEREKQEEKEDKKGELISPNLPPLPKEVAPMAQVATTQLSHYLNPETFALFYQMVGTIFVLTATRGITKTEVLLNSPAFAKSKFYGSRIAIEKYETAPDSLNIRLVGNEDAVTTFNENLPSLMTAFKKGGFSFRIGRLEAEYSSE